MFSIAGSNNKTDGEGLFLSRFQLGVCYIKLNDISDAFEFLR